MQTAVKTLLLIQPKTTAMFGLSTSPSFSDPTNWQYAPADGSGTGVPVTHLKEPGDFHVLGVGLALPQLLLVFREGTSG